MSEKTKVYTYTRVSTAMQIDGYSLDAQKSRVKSFDDFNDFEIVQEVLMREFARIVTRYRLHKRLNEQGK